MYRKRERNLVGVQAVIMVVGLTWCCDNRVAMANPIAPGFNLLATPDLNTTFIDLDIPGFISPQRVFLKGEPLDPDGSLTGDPLYDTDTIVRRVTGTNIAVGERDNIAIELVALSLVSVAPVMAQDGTFFDVRIESGSLLNNPSSPLFRDLGIPSSPIVQHGMTISQDNLNGGYWQAWLQVQDRTTFTEVGNPGNIFAIFDHKVYETLPAGVWSRQSVTRDLSGSATATVDHPTFTAGGFFPAVSPGPIPAPVMPGMTFSVDYQGPSAGGTPGPFTGLPDGFFGVAMDEGSIYTPTPPGPPGPNPPSFGPLPAPGLEVSAVAGGPGIVPGGLHIVPGVYGAVELDALSYGKDFGDRLYFSVDEFAVGIPGAPVPPNVTTEGAGFGSSMEASADVFVYLGPKAPTPPPPIASIPGNMDVIDGDGLFPFGGPGSGLIEPNPPTVTGVPDPGDNLDALDLDTVLAHLFGPIFLSLDTEFVDPLEAFFGMPPNTGTAVGNGFVGGDVLVQPVRSTPLTLYADAFVNLGLDAWADGDPFTEELDTDDLDALTLIDDGAVDLLGNLFFDPAVDTLLFSVRRGSAVIGVLDSAFGIPIEEGDILGPPAGPGLPPEIFIAAEALGLTTVRSGTATSYGVINPTYSVDLWADDLDALDMVDDRPPVTQPPGQKVLTNTQAFILSDLLVASTGLAAHAWIPAQGDCSFQTNCPAGDFDGDLDVDGFDFLAWQRGDSPNPFSGTDLAAWEANYGIAAPLAEASAAVPEPGTVALALVVLGSGLCLRCRQFT